MTKESVTWIVIADGARARILEAGSDFRHLTTVDQRTWPAGRKRTHELVSDRPGRSFESATAGRHSVGENTNPHRRQKWAFARQLAKTINDAHAGGRFARLIVVAPLSILHELRDGLDDPARAAVKAELVKDLTRVPIADLPDHLMRLGGPSA